MSIDDIMIERLIELATKAGYKPSGDILKDAPNEMMLCRFAVLVAAELNQPAQTEQGGQHG